jgi:hypothetical protein
VKFEVRYPTGSPHEVTLQGTVAILGRDPSCDLVLNDPRCSRRHAVIEAGPQGLSVRDTGSANGVVVNGSKVERAVLKPGDEIRVGEIVLKVLVEDMPGTVVMGPEDMVDFAGGPPPPQPAPPAPAAPARPPEPRGPTPTTSLPPVAEPPAAAPRPAPPAPRPPAPPPAPRVPPPPRPSAAPEPRPAVPPRPPATRRPPPPPVEEEIELEDAQGPLPRPLAVTLLTGLWVLGVLLYAGGGLWLAAVSQGPTRIGAIVSGGLLSLLSVAMAFGLWTRAGWARVLQIVLAVVGILTCAFAPVSIAILVYMLRADTRLQFSGMDLGELSPQDAERVSRDASGLPFTLAILGGLVVSLLLAGGASFLLGRLGGGLANLPQADSSARESVAIVNLRTLASAQQAFRAGTCDGYSDLGGLMDPSSLIANYPAGGPAFLPQDFALAERGGYRYDLQVEEPMELQDGCPSRLYRRYAFSASPIEGSGRHFLITADGQVRVAEDRPATPEDPIL